MYRLSILPTNDIIQTMKKMRKTNLILLRSMILIVILYAWLTLLSALLGIFYAPAIFALWLLTCILFYHKKILQLPSPSGNFLTYIFIIIGFVLTISYFTTPTIFSGRDQGSLSEASIRLAQNHTLIQHTPASDVFFDIYGRGKALNFPGFFYTPDGGLITQFPLPYISFLGGFFGIFGVTGFVIANAILLFIFIVSITAVARNYLNHKYTLIFLAILLTSFSIGWFAKFTLSENIASMLLWSAFALYFPLKKSPSLSTYFIFLSAISLLLFSRIEGIWFFIIFLILIFRNKSIKQFVKKDIWWRLAFPLTILFVISCTVLIMNMPFFITMATASTNATSDITNSSNIIDKLIYLFSTYTLYGLLFPLLLTCITGIISIRYKKYRQLMLPVLIILPLTIYYFFPQISSDHPWMLRRFVFALLPATILISIAFISYIKPSNLFKHVAKYLILSILLIANLFTFFTFITYSENSTLQKQITELSKDFGNNDLILIDKNAAASGWSLITNPMRSLENKHAAYFFNPYDFEKLDTTSFDNVFLITSNKNKHRYLDVLSDKMSYVKKYVIVTEQLDITKSKAFPPKTPKKENYTIRGTIYKLTTP